MGYTGIAFAMNDSRPDSIQPKFITNVSLIERKAASLRQSVLSSGAF